MPKKLKRFLLGLASMLVAMGVVAGIEALRERAFRAAPAELVMAAALLPLYLAGARWIERRHAEELRLANAARGIGGGLLLGVAMFSCLMGILWLAAVYQPSGWGPGPPLAFALVSALAGAVLEETLFRGYLFRLAAGLGGNWTALAVTSALFGLAHLGNRGATLASSAAIAIEAGILLGAAYAASGSLWLPIGIHAGWNLAEGPLFGMAVSGNAQQSAWINGSLHGPVLLTGGVFGPEASVAAVVVCLAVAAIYLRKMVALSRDALTRRGPIEPGSIW